MRALLIATRNKGKLREIKDILSDLSFEVKSLDDIGFVDKIVEQGNTFAENATIKAKTVGRKTGFLTLAEDSGLKIDALGGKPGITSARYVKGTDLDRITRVLDELKGVPKEKRTARFKSVVAIYTSSTKRIYTFEGTSGGLITQKPIGKGGFGYDPIFYNLDLGKTNAQATQEEKNRVSHRAMALEKAKELLKMTFQVLDI